MINVLLADDQTLVRQGIRSLLALTPDIRVVAEAEDGEVALSLIGTTQFDVVLLDVRMPKKTGLDVLQAMKHRPQAPPAIILTTFDDDAVAASAMKFGAKGYLLKDIGKNELSEAIRDVFSGKTIWNPVVTERVVRGLDKLRPGFAAIEAPTALPPREPEIWRLIAPGYSNRENAQIFDHAHVTGHNHRVR